MAFVMTNFTPGDMPGAKKTNVTKAKAPVAQPVVKPEPVVAPVEAVETTPEVVEEAPKSAQTAPERTYSAPTAKTTGKKKK